MKNNPFTRFLSVALTAVMLVGVMPGAVLADAGEAIVGASSAVVESIPESTTPADAAPVATEVPPVTEPEATPEAAQPEASPEVEATPEATEQPETTPEATQEPEATPEATEQPEATPEATQEPEATPEATEQPEATPEATQEPEATPEATEEPEATPEATEEPETSPEPTEEPVELNKEAYIETAEVAEGVTVTVKVPANTLPEGVNLVAEMLAEDTQAHADAEAALAEAEVQYDGMIAMDIRFEDAEGNEVEPANEVEVSINAQALLPEDADPETVAVQHLKEDETGAVTVETVANTDAATGDIAVAENAEQPALNMASTFAVDGFSTFTIIWRYYAGDVTVHYVDTEGNPIDGTQIDDEDFDNREWVDLNDYAGNIEGYTFVEYRYGSNFSSSDLMADADESPQIRYYYGDYYYRTNDYGDGDLIRWNGRNRNIYLVYEADSQSGGETGETSATVTTGKTLTLQNGQQPGGLYDLTLSVSGDRGSTEKKAMLDVLFILDESNSMGESWGSQKRIKAAKDAIGQIMGYGDAVGLSDNENLDVQYSLVGFGGGDSKKGEDWWDPDRPYVDAGIEQGWTNNVNSVYDAIPDITYNPYGYSTNRYGGGTNYEAGFRTGKEALASARDGALKVVIFISDGGPGYYYNNGYTAGTGNPNNYDEDALQHGVNECKGLNADYFYFVGVTSDVTGDVFTNITNSVSVPASNKDSISANDPEDLLKAFEDIQQNITFYACSDVTITDPLSAYAELAENAQYTVKVTKTDESGNTTTVKEGTVPSGQGVTFNSGTGAQITLTPSYDDQTRTITLDFPDAYELEEGYTYSVTTTVQPTDAATEAGTKGYNGLGEAGTGSHAGQPGFYSNNNESAKVTFKPTVNNQPGDEQSESFPKPVIQVFDPGDVEMETPAHTKQAILNDDGTYDLTLTVSGSTGTATKKAEVDVLMVVDVSNSMNNYGRLGNTKNAMTALVNTLKANNTVDAQYSIVTFSGPRWTDTAGSSSNAAVGLDWNSNTTTVINSIDDISTTGATNYEAGLEKAVQQLADARSTATTVVVFLSDGAPTVYNGGGDGSNSLNRTGTGWKSTLAEAAKINCSQFYAVGISSSQKAYMTDLRDAVNAATSEYIEAADDGSNLADKFKDIAGSVTALLCEDVTITDTLSQYAEAVIGADGKPEKLEVKVTDANGADATEDEVAAGSIVASYDATDKTVKLDFKDDYKLKANYTYSVTLKIKPTGKAVTDLAANSGVYPDTPDEGTGTHADRNENGFYSNDAATLTYKITGIDQKHEVPYDKPVIQVSKGNLLITKTFTGLSDTEIKALEDTLTFTYTNLADDTDFGTVKLGGMQLKDGKYQYLVENLDVNARYKVTESGYEVADYDRTGSDVEETVTIASGQTVSADFTNDYTWNPKGSLTINKTLTSFNPSMGDDATFQFRIEAISGKYKGRVWYRYITFEKAGTDDVLLDNLPVGEYQVTELDSAGYKLAENILPVQIGQITKTAPDAAVNYTNESTGGNIPGDQDIVRNNFKYVSGQGWIFEQQQEQQQP